MKPIKFGFFMCIFLFNPLVQAKGIEHRLWAQLPLNIDLAINHERMIRFNQKIKIVGDTLHPGFDIIKVKNRLYITAKKLLTQRLIVQLQENNEVILLDLHVSEKTTGSDIITIDTEDEPHSRANPKIDYDYSAIVLTRLAIQSLYSPRRLVSNPSGIHRITMRSKKRVPLFYGASIAANPIASWQAGARYVTAVELLNLLDKPIHLSTHMLKGLWQTASFYPSIDLPASSKHQTTSVFLVSSEPFVQSLNQVDGYLR